ncbi:uncharacterized protein LOC132728887 [Ruditapes philippinarum]|uniref:uncharacterized protein LOC132728887 n=1 Tax=Ruditapes philippinarum TaxID=129788 RepID=UPI00295BEFC6|nr:uncharacterized protein LOC132728887 [Ruditapes philippinarum]
MFDQSSQDDGKCPGQRKRFFMPKMQRKFVNLGSMTGRWMKIKSKKCCKSDEDLARLLIQSLHQLDQQIRYGGHISRYLKRRNIPKHESYRIITLQTDVWARWRELQCSLQVNSNSQFANVLMNAWHDRADYIPKLWDASKASQRAPVNETQVIQVVKKEAGMTEAPVNETSMHKNLVESANVNEAFVNETSMNKYLVEDASVNKAPVTEPIRSTWNYLVEDAPVNDASVNNTSRKSSLYFVEDAFVNKAPVTEALNKYLVEDASVNKAPVTEALNKYIVEDASVNKALWTEALNKYPMEDTSVNKAPVTEALNKYLVEDASVNKAPRTEALHKYRMEDASVNKASVTEALNKYPEEDASVNKTSWTEALNKYLMEDASVNKAPVTEALDKCPVDDASVNEAPLSEGCMNKCYYLMEDVPDASVNNTIRNKYLGEDVLVNKALATVAFKNKVLVEHAYVKKAPAPGNDAPVAEDLGNKFLVEDASMNVIPDTLNEVLVKQEIMTDQSDKISSEPCREVSPECPDVKEEYVSEGEESVSEESESDTEIENIMNYLKADKKMIKITEDATSTEDNAELGNRRRSSRVQSRGYRPNYASLDWINDHEKNSDDNVSEIVVTKEDKHIHGRRQHTSPADTTVTEDDKFKNDFKTKRKVKDPDFFPDEIECLENLDEIDDSSETDDEESYTLENEGDSLTECKNKDMRKRKRKFGKSVGNNCKKRKKSWVHIKLDEHQDKYSKEIVKSFARKDRNVDVTEELFKCLICGNFKSTARDLFEEHIEKHVNKVLECDKCSYVGNSEFVLLKHKFSVGHASGNKQFICDICGIVLYTSDARLSHMGKKHGDPQFKCSYCDEKFATNSRRKKHHRTVHTDLVKYCFICESDYSHLSLEYFRDHQSSCKVTNQCQVCGVCLSTKSGLKKHIESIHMNVRNYQCSTCPYSAKCAQRLKEHELSHRSDHQYFCDKCTFTCVQKYQLKSHMRTHTGEKPYKCSQCKFAAAWNVQLKEHVKVHGMENTVACSHCDIVFRNQKALKMHEKKDHPEIPGNIKKSKKRR